MEQILTFLGIPLVLDDAKLCAFKAATPEAEAVEHPEYVRINLPTDTARITVLYDGDVPRSASEITVKASDKTITLYILQKTGRVYGTTYHNGLYSSAPLTDKCINRVMQIIDPLDLDY